MTGASDESQEHGERRPRFLADEGFNMDVTLGLRRRYPAMDVMTVQEARLLHVDDRVLLQATQRNATQRLDRILLSHDTHTMRDHFYAVLAQQPVGVQLPGVLLVAQEATIGQAIEWITEVWLASRHEEWRAMVESSCCDQVCARTPTSTEQVVAPPEAKY
ncbi:MAG TPA: DUF5615 family PIN-like protein [Ktedonobacterales bacterium]|nr:DUF5615 family PIN-like protein [Ktedonobacterales bacterium]